MTPEPGAGICIGSWRFCPALQRHRGGARAGEGRRFVEDREPGFTRLLLGVAVDRDQAVLAAAEQT